MARALSRLIESWLLVHTMRDTSCLFRPQTMTSSEHLLPFTLCHGLSHELKVCICVCLHTVSSERMCRLHFKMRPQQGTLQVSKPIPSTQACWMIIGSPIYNLVTRIRDHVWGCWHTFKTLFNIISHEITSPIRAFLTYFLIFFPLTLADF